MHELSITASVVDAVVEKMGEATVVRVRLEIGRLSGVVVDSLRFCFDLITEDTTLAGAVLQVDQPAGLARCRSCGAEFPIDDLLAICACGGIELDVLAGQDMRIKEVEVR
ncbi:MAG: hydrogenase maturation nickel metallochaperone HypA [Sciscionella sp.]